MKLLGSSARRSPVRGLVVTALAGLVAMTPAVATATAPAGHSVDRGAAPGAPPAPREIVDAVHDIVRAGAPGVTAYVRRDGQVWKLSAGEADLATHRRARPNDRARVGSVTKTYIATILLQLESEGRLSLDDTVADWLPGLIRGHGNDGRAMTVRMLLNHSSGLPDYLGDVFPAVWETDDRNVHFTPAELVQIAMKHEPTYAPGSDSTYSNTGYVVAGMVIEAVTGRGVAHAIKTRIARPLGLTRTSYPTTSAAVRGRHLEGYLENFYYDFENVTRLGPSWASAAGAVISTPAEVARFHRALFAGRLLPPAQLRELTTVVTSTTIPGVRNGLGFSPVHVCGQEVWTKDGSYPGYLTQSFTTRDARSQVVYTINSDSYAINHQRVQRAEKRLQQAALC